MKLLSLRSDEEIGPLSPLAVSLAAGFSGSVAAAASHCFDTAKTRTQCIVLPKVCYLLLKQFLYFLEYTTNILIIFTYHLILRKWCLFHLLPCDFISFIVYHVILIFICNMMLNVCFLCSEISLIRNVIYPHPCVCMCLFVLAQGDQTLMGPTKSINPSVGGLDNRKMGS